MVTATLAALGGAVVFWVAAMGPLRGAAPWIAATVGGMAAAAALLAWTCRRRVAGPDAAVRDTGPQGTLASEAWMLQPNSGDAATGDVAAALRAAFDAAAEPMIRIGRDGRVLDANQAAQMLLGPASAPGAAWDGTAEATVPWPAWMTPERRPLADGGALVVGRHHTAERLRAQQIEAMDARAELAGAIVHDMNNALGAVAGYADFLVTDLPTCLPPGAPQADYAVRIVNAVDRSRTALRRLMSAARLDPLDLRPDRAARVLSSTAALLHTAPAIPASLSIRDEPGAPDVICDTGLLARTLAGLALDLTDAAGRAPEARLCLRVAAWNGECGPAAAADADVDAAAIRAGWRVRTLLAPRPGLHALFELRIDGPPLADEVLFALVDPLLSARARARRGGDRARGDADAVPAALLVARRHDGGLELRTHPAEGTVVRIHIPGVPSALPSPRPVPAVPDRSVRAAPVIQVLVVDRDPAAGDRLQSGLERQGCEVSVCDDAGDALEIVADEPAFFDVVVVGPGLGASSVGRTLVARLKALRPDLPCVLYGAGPADLTLPPPVDLPRLARGVAALAAGHPAVGPVVGEDRA
ncbi:hypothetical protein TSO352_01865 [Azospirillum sp. TSO35-2]|nr:hypothetical protein TSO352_01865 [Azospirillum sp. TSO35-2]